jgi:hypothetical protein
VSFTCPRCGATSHNPNDEREGYCGACHAFTGSAPRVAAEPAELTHAGHEALLVTRRISLECDQFHQDAEDAGCPGWSCMCWCHQ